MTALTPQKSRFETGMLPQAIDGTGSGIEEGHDPEGYLQLHISEEGAISLRGTRLIVDWLLRKLANEGWSLEIENTHWCG